MYLLWVSSFAKRLIRIYEFEFKIVEMRAIFIRDQDLSIITEKDSISTIIKMIIHASRLGVVVMRNPNFGRLCFMFCCCLLHMLVICRRWWMKIWKRFWNKKMMIRQSPLFWRDCPLSNWISTIWHKLILLQTRWYYWNQCILRSLMTFAIITIFRHEPADKNIW
jgi:hypothetical protein